MTEEKDIITKIEDEADIYENMNQYDWLKIHGLEVGQKVYYHNSTGEGIVTVKEMGTYLDQYDVLLVEEFDGFILPSDVRTIDYYMSLIADLCGEDSDVIYFLKHGQKTPKIIPYGKSETEEQFANMMAMALLIGDEKGEFTDKAFGYHDGVWFHTMQDRDDENLAITEGVSEGESKREYDDRYGDEFVPMFRCSNNFKNRFHGDPCGCEADLWCVIEGSVCPFLMIGAKKEGK